MHYHARTTNVFPPPPRARQGLEEHWQASGARRFALLLVLTTVGCGGSNNLSLTPVAGTVAYEEAPLTQGMVVFTPEAGTPGPQAVGNIESNGSFRMQTAGQEGVVQGGSFRVTVHCRRKATAEELEKLESPPSLIPIKYSRNEESNLRYQATEEDTHYAIELE